jgi:hypothetical protein
MWHVEQWPLLGDWLRVASQVMALRAVVIGSRGCHVMSLLDCCLSLLFRPCWGGRLSPVEEDGTHNARTAWANRWALPQVHAIIGSFLIRHGVKGGVPSEDNEGCGSSTDSHFDHQ